VFGLVMLVGVQAAAPILFDVFDLLPKSDWFAKPFDEMQEVEICTKSGYRATDICDGKEKTFIQISGLKSKPCPYHILIHLDKSEQFQVNSSCEDLADISHKPWFKLPPLMEFYYKSKNPFYKPLPKFRLDCQSQEKATMEFIYPKSYSSIFLPKDFDGKTNELVLKIAHSEPETTVYWYLDQTYVGSTKNIHDMAIIPTIGEHVITTVDALGNEAKRKINITK